MAEGLASIEDYFRLERFLQREADLLDRRAFGEWLALLSADIVYRVSSRQIRDSAAGPKDLVIMDETFAGLKSRTDQIGNPRLTHAENPPSLTRRFVTIIEATLLHTDNFHVRSNILIHRVRPEDDTGRLFAAERTDRLRLKDGALHLTERHVRLDHALIHGGAITLLF